MAIRLHLLGIPYSITSNEYSSCAFTGKVLRFSKMMRARGFEVYHYGIETSVSNANKQFDVLSVQEWTDLRIKTLQFLDPSLSVEEATLKNNDSTLILNAFASVDSPLFEEFNKRLKTLLTQNYKTCDIVCLPLGRAHQAALDDSFVVVEIGIGYSNSFADYRVFESNTWLAHTVGEEENIKHPPNYWFVIPNSYNISEYAFMEKPEWTLRICFLGRIIDLKGCNIIVEIAKRFPHVTFVLCGPGSPESFLNVPNVIYEPPIHGTQRSLYLGNCAAVLCPSVYLEPFCGVAVEAQLCGTPVISSDHGGFTETIEQMKTGIRCHTLADYCHGVQLALDGFFDRAYIRERAVKNYDMHEAAKMYEYVFRSILDIHRPPKSGWYAERSHLLQSPMIYLIIPYFGQFPNYFQLYLNSLAKNEDILNVILITDIDLSPYILPPNLTQVEMTLDAVRDRLVHMLSSRFNTTCTREEVVQIPYKLVDLKIAYGVLFEDILNVIGVGTQDLVGWGDIDVIYGKLSHFIDLKSNSYDIIGGSFGHFSALKNRKDLKELFLQVENYANILTDNSKTYIADEIQFQIPLKRYIETNKSNVFHMHLFSCDVVPPQFYHMFRVPLKEKNFFNTIQPQKNIQYIHYNSNTGVLTTVYDSNDSNDSEQHTYCHLQKRKMELHCNNITGDYYIGEHKFNVIL